MGVLGLWQLLQPTARSAKIEGLEGKVLAIDISIWLYQATRGAKNSPNGHITVLYNRLCKLMYYKVKPIFIFDGPNVPRLKQRVLQERRNRHTKVHEKNKTLENRIKKGILNSQAGPSTSSKRKSPPSVENNDDIDEIFKLPENAADNLEADGDEDSPVEVLDEDSVASSGTSYASYVDYEQMDKEVFDSLPDDIKYEIVSEHRARLKETRKQSLYEFPQKSEDFSDYQLKLLFQKGKLLNQISDIKKSIASSYSAGTDYDDVYYQKVASTVDHEVVLLKKKTSSLFSIGKSSSTESTDDAKKETDENYAGFFQLLEKNLIKKDDDKKEEVQESFSLPQISQRLQNAANKPDSNEKNRFEDEPIHIEVDSSQNKAPEEQSICQPDNEIEIQHEGISKSQIVEDSIKESIVEPIIDITTEVRDKPIEEIPTDVESESEDGDFVEVESRPNYDSIMEEVRDTLAKKSDELMRGESISDLDSIKLISQALDTSKDLEVIDETGNQAANTELFNEVAGLMRQKATTAQVDYSALSSNRIESFVIEDAKHLLRMFGLPYVESPGEAEAQCAYLDYTNMTDGSITDDSDTWLFGGRRVYKNFFGAEPCIDVYTIETINSLLGLDRNELINLALLVGSDYTTGIENVGVVKAVEILNEFQGVGIEKLKSFKEWYDKQKEKRDLHMSKFRQALAKLKIPDSFPSEIVVNAYQNPDVDRSRREFTWTLPELDSLRKYLVNKLGWTVKKIDDDLLPIIKRIQDKMIQKTIENFFLYDKRPTFSKQSKRMISAIETRKNQSSSVGSIQDDVELSESGGSDDDYGPRTSKGNKKTSNQDLNLGKAKKAKRAPKKKTSKK